MADTCHGTRAAGVYLHGKGSIDGNRHIGICNGVHGFDKVIIVGVKRKALYILDNFIGALVIDITAVTDDFHLDRTPLQVDKAEGIGT